MSFCRNVQSASCRHFRTSTLPQQPQHHLEDNESVLRNNAILRRASASEMPENQTKSLPYHQPKISFLCLNDGITYMNPTVTLVTTINVNITYSE